MHENLNTNPVFKRFVHSHVSKCNSFFLYTVVLTRPPIKVDLVAHTLCIMTDISPQFTCVLLINSTHERMTEYNGMQNCLFSARRVFAVVCLSCLMAQLSRHNLNIAPV